MAESSGWLGLPRCRWSSGVTNKPGRPGRPWKGWTGVRLPDIPLAEPRAPLIPFKVAFPPPYFFSCPLLSVVLLLFIFCLILATVVCMGGQGGRYNFPRTEVLGLCGSFFLEAWRPCSASQPISQWSGLLPACGLARGGSQASAPKLGMCAQTL